MNRKIIKHKTCNLKRTKDECFTLHASGFTLIELVVVIGVIAVVSSLMLANFPRFNKQIVVEREASKLALALRRAQAFALAVREFNSSFNDDPFCLNPPVRFPGYGVFVSLGEPIKYFIYGDVSCSRYYESAPVEEIAELINFEGNVIVSSIRGFDASICSGGCDLDEISVLYVRPGPTIWIRSGGVDYNSAEMILSSADGLVQKTVTARFTGQVSIE